MVNEQVFFVMPNGDEVEARNESPHLDSFLVSVDDTITYLDDAVAIRHTHPDQSHHLSTSDRMCQIQTGLPWMLHGRTYRPCEPLLGRAFNHGEVDCYSLMRDLGHLSHMVLQTFSQCMLLLDHGFLNSLSILRV